MRDRLATSILLLFLGSNAVAQTIHRSPEVPRFMGREVVITEPATDEDGFFPKGPASICIEGPPQEQCYTAPENFGGTPKAEFVQVEKDVAAVLFSADSGGVSGWGIHFALLRPGNQKTLEDLFVSDTSVSNQSEHEFWADSTLSPAKIFVTANFVWGPDEAHYSPHRYTISVYVLKHTREIIDDSNYYLEDRYMTGRSYDSEKDHILASERPEIIARLRRLKAGAKTDQAARHKTAAH